MRGGKRKGSGRKPGSPNRVDRELREYALKLAANREEMPLDFLLKVMRAPEPTQRPGEHIMLLIARYKRWDEDRLEAAKAAVPYCHAKLATVEHTGKDGKPAIIEHRFVFDVVKTKPRELGSDPVIASPSAEVLEGGRLNRPFW